MTIVKVYENTMIWQVMLPDIKKKKSNIAFKNQLTSKHSENQKMITETETSLTMVTTV